MGLLKMFGYGDTPFGRFADENRYALGAIGSGLASGTSLGRGLANAAANVPQARMMDFQRQTQTREEQQRKEQLNQTMRWAQSMAAKYPDDQRWAQLAQAGEMGMPAAEIFKTGMQHLNPAKPTDDMREYRLAQMEGFEGSFLDFQTAVRKAGATNVDNTFSPSGGEGKKFYETLDASQAGMFGTLLNEGMTARNTLIKIDRLDDLLSNVDTGAAGALKQLAGNWGIQTEGLDDIQAAQALINQLVPSQRPVGSGPMSDADLELFKQSMPRLINSPGGNKLITETLRGIAQYQIEQSEIAAQVADRTLTPAQGRQALAALKNPLAGFSATAADDSDPLGIRR